ncbi:hypothetical protein BFV96_4454 [Alteromonas macleodii]|nr:hypothetical protein BFV93_4257 [Alteromonas macleodii]OES38608.1 hypothetical protein BFV96_4719 [Alteromonas macleodii]OES38960.1 hypothetical protein BFV96_4454 [Alteromonas macleodii]
MPGNAVCSLDDNGRWHSVSCAGFSPLLHLLVEVETKNVGQAKTERTFFNLYAGPHRASRVFGVGVGSVGERRSATIRLTSQ